MKKLLLLLFSICIFTSFSPKSFAYQFSTCNEENHVELKKHLKNTIASYPANTQEQLNSDNIIFEPKTLSYEPISTHERWIYRGNEKITGLFANYLLVPEDNILEDFKKALPEMKKNGFIGVSLEIPWYEYEPEDNVFTPPKHIEEGLKAIRENNMYAVLLLSPHYTPEWVFEKYEDIYLYDENNNKIVWNNLDKHVPEEGAYLTFSPFSSEGLYEQTEWQTHAVNYYEQKEEILAIFLSNEQSYPKFKKTDYSIHAQKAWIKFLEKNKLESAQLPTKKTDPNYIYFEKFLQNGLNDFQRKIIEAVTEYKKTNILLGHKMMIYETMSAFSDQFHHKFTSTSYNSPIVVNDVYGFTPNVYAMTFGANKPVFTAETNMLGNCSAEFMYDYIMFQYLHGSSIISIFRWKNGEDFYSLLDTNGNIKERSKGVLKAAKKILSLQDFDYPTSLNLLILPQNEILKAAYKNSEYNVNNYIENFWKENLFISLHFAEEIIPEIYQSEYEMIPSKGSLLFLPHGFTDEEINTMKLKHPETKIYTLSLYKDLPFCNSIKECALTHTFPQNTTSFTKGKTSNKEKISIILKIKNTTSSFFSFLKNHFYFIISIIISFLVGFIFGKTKRRKKRMKHYKNMMY